MARPPEVQLFRGAKPFWSNRHQKDFCGAPRGRFDGDLRRREGEGQGAQDPNAMDVNREERWKGDWRCFNCGMFRHMARHYRNPREVKEGTQKASKDQGDQ